MRRRERGFTLVEVLVGTTIFAMMLALLANALSAMTRNVRAGEARLTRIDDTRLVEAFLRRQLGEAVPLTERIDDERHALFDGRSDRLRFVGHLPAHRGGGGLQYLDLALRAPDRGEARSADPAVRDLVLYHRDAWPDIPFDSRDGDPAWEGQSLVPDVKRVRYRYFGNTDDKTAPEWRDSWSNADRLPLLVRVDIEASDGRSLPTIVAAVRSRVATGQAALVRARKSGGR
jgi:general secretion pathway protein J